MPMRWLLVCLVACTPSQPPVLPGPPPPPAEIVQHADLIARLEARGAKVTHLADGQTLVCPQHAHCVCLTELHCDGECITLAKNLDIFQRALRGEGKGSVSCEIADTGKLCDTSYFRFEGDIYRWEDRYFDASGHLIGQRNGTDYPEYCGGKAGTRIMGAVPDCKSPARDVKRICNDDENANAPPLGNPMERLLP